MKISLLLIAAAIAPPLLAQTATPPLVPDVPHSQTIMDTLINAGPVMIPLFLLSIFFVALVIVYLMTIRRGAVVSSGYMATADALLRKRDYLGLLAVSNRHGEAIARVVHQYGRGFGSRHSIDDVLPFFPRQSPTVNLRIRSRLDASFRFAFVALCPAAPQNPRTEQR